MAAIDRVAGGEYRLEYKIGSGAFRQGKNDLDGSSLEQEMPLSKYGHEPEDNALALATGSPRNSAEINVEDGADITPIIAPGAAQASASDWLTTIESVVKGVVSIHFCQTSPFDTDRSTCSQATGFVVDAKRGYILTNRHVACAGPFWGYCVFNDHEACDVYPIYRDPVHDFGFLKYNPNAIKHMVVTALKLNPKGAQVGVEIKVIGNDAGEKLSILSGVISRLDRNAPDYGEGYNDFNTNYIQAAAAASGGSSGSPVINMAGHVVALQAGGRVDGAATDYFLPLDRPLRALRCIQDGKPVTRGTIQTQWMIKPFDECRRLGLTSKWEDYVRKSAPQETGMLVAEIVLPKGPADGKIQEGDVLLEVNGELVTQFVRLDDTLDLNVGQSIQLLIQRGGEDLDIHCTVGDLHKITPDRFVSVAGGIFHDLSYQQARLYAIACRGVFVCEAAGSFNLGSPVSGWIIDSVDNQPTGNLLEFIDVMKTIPDRSKTVLSYRHIESLHTRNTTIIILDRHWYPRMSLAIRNDKTGLWDFSDIASPLPARPLVTQKADFVRLDGVSQTAAAEIVRSFVRISCTMPLNLDGFPHTRRIGCGLVLDAEKGLVVVSRAIVPYDLCDIDINVADSINVPGEVIFMHPLQNYAIVRYDPTLVKAPVRSAQMSTENIKQGHDTIFVGFNQSLRVVIARTSVTDTRFINITANTSAPRYRSINFDAITIDTGLSSQCATGVLLREDGVVQALWLSYIGEQIENYKNAQYHFGFATPSLLPIISQIQHGKIPKLRILNIESYTIQMSQARIMGVSEDWIQKVAETNSSKHQLFKVRKLHSPPPKFTHEIDTLKEEDIILTLNGKLITRVSEFDMMYDNEVLDALIVRNGREMHIKVHTVPTEDLETRRAIVFCGVVLQKPHLAVRQQISKLHSEVYISSRFRGSPAEQYQLPTPSFVVEINDVQTKDLETFVHEVQRIPDETYFRLRVVNLHGVPSVFSMKKNDHYFPMSEYVRDLPAAGWRLISLPQGNSSIVDKNNLTE